MRTESGVWRPIGNDAPPQKKSARPTYKIMRFAPLKARLPSAEGAISGVDSCNFCETAEPFLGGIHVPQRVQSDGTLQKSASCKLFALCSHKLHVHIILFKGIGHKARTVSAENDGRSRRRPTQESYNTSRIRKAMQNTDNKRFVAIGLMRSCSAQAISSSPPPWARLPAITSFGLSLASALRV